MKLAFSTLGCPRWSLVEIADAARQYGYGAIELRCLGGELDLAARAELQPDRIAGSREFLERRELEVCCVDTSAAFHALAESDRRKNVAVALRHAAIAAALGAPLIRVFPNEVPEGSTRAETRDRIAAGLREVASRMPRGVRLGLETHGDFATAEGAVEIVRLADHPSLGIVWDAANTVAAGEPVAVSAKRLEPHLLHVHLRDARPVEGERFWHPVLAGRGRVPFDEVVGSLRALRYAGWVSFEWEKYWHPEIEEPDVALADFGQALRRLDVAA